MSDLEELTERVRRSVGEDSGIDAKIKFDFGSDGRILIDASSVPNRVSNEDVPADVVLTLSQENFRKIIDHEISPKVALMTGRMRIRGMLRIALRLDPVFGTG
jgi:putative sterol carrier protein